MSNDIELPDLPEWSKMDNLGYLMPSEIRKSICDFARAAILADREKRAQAAQELSDEQVIDAAKKSTRQHIDQFMIDTYLPTWRAFAYQLLFATEASKPVQPVRVGTIAHIGSGKATLTAAIATRLREASKPVKDIRDILEECGYEEGELRSGNLALDAALGYVKRHTPSLVYSEICEAVISKPVQGDNRTTVDSGALTMALNVLRRAGRTEVADALEATAIRGAESKPAQAEAPTASNEREAPPQVFLVLQNLHPRFHASNHFVTIKKVVAVCQTEERAQTVRTKTEESYHEEFPGYRQYKEEPVYQWTVEEMPILAILATQQEAQPQAESIDSIPTSWELSWGGWDEESCWCVHDVGGGRNDREWTLIGTGVTPSAAIRAARAAQQATERQT